MSSHGALDEKEIEDTHPMITKKIYRTQYRDDEAKEQS
jgi:hypothetical protein